MREGELNGRSKLTWEKVIDIRWAYEHTGYSQMDIAKEYRLAQATVWSIVNNLTWKIDGKR